MAVWRNVIINRRTGIIDEWLRKIRHIMMYGMNAQRMREKRRSANRGNGKQQYI